MRIKHAAAFAYEEGQHVWYHCDRCDLTFPDYNANQKGHKWNDVLARRYLENQTPMRSNRTKRVDLSRLRVEFPLSEREH